MNKYRICIKGNLSDYVWIYLSGDDLQLTTIHGDDCLPDPTIVKLQGENIQIEFETHDITVKKDGVNYYDRR